MSAGCWLPNCCFINMVLLFLVQCCIIVWAYAMVPCCQLFLYKNICIYKISLCPCILWRHRFILPFSARIRRYQVDPSVVNVCLKGCRLIVCCPCWTEYSVRSNANTLHTFRLESYFNWQFNEISILKAKILLLISPSNRPHKKLG